MKAVQILFGGKPLGLELPDGADILGMGRAIPLTDPAGAIQKALAEPTGTPSLQQLARRALAARAGATAVVVVSDNTRPVPYRGEQGILWPVLRHLLEAGFAPGSVLVLVASGTHRPLGSEELRRMLDPRVFSAGVQVECHDATDRPGLARVGTTASGMEVLVSRRYLAADLRVLTGLVESHFIAGVSGGRKSICPGLVGEATTYRFHSAQIMASPAARDLNLEGNPCHREALEAARLVGADFIVNVTLDQRYRLTGVFAGELERAHLRAFEFLRSYVSIPLAGRYDLVITHGGAVAVNHYQAVKAALAALPAVRPCGTILLLAAHTEPNPIGSERYRSLLHLLRLVGHEAFRRLLFSPDWTFIPEQWEVQAWARVLSAVGPEGLVYYSPQFAPEHYAVVPGADGSGLLPESLRGRLDPANPSRVVAGVLERARRARGGQTGEPRIAFLADGPYGILRPSRPGGEAEAAGGCPPAEAAPRGGAG
jgi:nickel-dependent lactate racemase